MKMIDVHGLAGGLSLGLDRIGLHMEHRAGLSFGSKNVLANREHFSRDFTYEHSDDNDAFNWNADFTDVDVVAAVPPCSGFSALSSRDFRGVDSPANECMWSAARYAGRIAPQIFLFESVSAAFNQGRPLMQSLRAELEAVSGKSYTLYHYKHNGLGVGGSSIRARYFFIASQIPFGVNRDEIEQVPSIMESIGDLAGLEQRWEAQPYRQPASWWSEDYRSPDGYVDGHVSRKSMHSQRMDDIMAGVEWVPGMDEAAVVKAYWEKYGRLPESFAGIAARVEAKLRDTEVPFSLGFNGTARWRPSHPAFVTTGDAGNKIIHPTEDRLLTARELFRIQGFPDTWKLAPLQKDSKLYSYPGKGVNVKVGEHLGEALVDALNGNPREDQGVEIGEREYLIDHGGLHKRALEDLLLKNTGDRRGRTVAVTPELINV